MNNYMNQKGFVNIVLVVLVVVLAGVAGYFVLIKKSAPFITTNISAPTQQAPSASTNNIGKRDEIKVGDNWDVYTNQQYHFTLQYPKDFKPFSTLDDPATSGQVLTIQSPNASSSKLADKHYPLPMTVRGAMIVVAVEASTQPLDVWVAGKKQSLTGYGSKVKILSEFENGFSFVYTNLGPKVQLADGSWVDQYAYDKRTYFFNKNTGVGVTLVFSAVTKDDQIAYESVYDRAVASFRFQ